MKASNPPMTGSCNAAATHDVAAAWFVRRDSGDFTDDDQRAFEAWLSESAVHAQAWQQVQLAWSSFDAHVSDELDALRAAALRDTTPAVRRPWLPWLGGIAAAALGTLVFVAREPMRELPAAPAPQAQAQAQTAEAAPRPRPLEVGESRGQLSAVHGQSLRARLPDGSIVTLNTDSVIDFEVAAGSRSVRLLKGQAFFEVAHDREHPFVVSAGDQRITALGTSFDVYVDSGLIKVVLVDGRVAVSSTATPGQAARRPTLLSPGDELRVSPTGQMHVTPVNVTAKTMWRDGLIAFDDVSLADAVTEINRYSDRPIVIEGEAIGALRISGVFHTDSPDRFADSAAEVLPVRVLREGGRIVLRE
jgi:transmembrane sensor